MNWQEIKTVEQHIIIRNTIGYDVLNTVEPFNIPNVLKFLQIVDNYSHMQRINNT